MPESSRTRGCPTGPAWRGLSVAPPGREEGLQARRGNLGHLLTPLLTDAQATLPFSVSLKAETPRWNEGSPSGEIVVGFAA